MDDRLRICLWMLGGGGFGGALGCVFGAVTAAIYERSGGAAGTRLARSVVENFLQSGDRQPSPTLHAALIGGADGFFFMGCLGLFGGSLLGRSGLPVSELLIPMVAGSVVLVGGAIVFGSMAYALRYYAAQFLYISVCTFVLGILTSSLFGDSPRYFAIGAGVGPIIGLTLCRIVRAYSPKYHPPRIDRTIPPPRSDTETDITGSIPPSTNDDAFHK